MEKIHENVNVFVLLDIKAQKRVFMKIFHLVPTLTPITSYDIAYW